MLDFRHRRGSRGTRSGRGEERLQNRWEEVESAKMGAIWWEEVVGEAIWWEEEVGETRAMLCLSTA